MLILSLSQGGHDSSAAVLDDYKVLAAVQTERLTRRKGDGQYAHTDTINAALKIAGADLRDVDVLVSPGGRVPASYFKWPPLRALRYAAKKRFGKKEPRKMVAQNRDRFNTDKLLAAVGLPKGTPFFLCNHHFAHALSALFFTDWPGALLYTADGGGDTVQYSMNHFDGAAIHELYGDRSGPAPRSVDSVGLAYGFMTEALGYRKNRHEGKLTGLAAYGEPAILDKLETRFSVDDDGRIHADFADHYREMRAFIHECAKTTTPENAAASIQQLLERMVLRSMKVFLDRTGESRVGMAGGVFANVTLNRKVAELPGVEEVFIFPGMCDDGLAIGGACEFLLERDGLETWLSRRHRLDDVYWGAGYDDETPRVFSADDLEPVDGDVAENTARLLAEGMIVALYCGRMEFGPRALGARSILASPVQREINDTLNKRLARTEFMPFAPYVLEEDVDEVFELPDASRYAARFMTITCMVREEWQKRIPAVVHLDGTARPQIVRDHENPLYAAILRRFKAATGLPVLVNTSFNAHEEPIIHTPAEALRALRHRRVDYVAAPGGLWKLRSAS